MNKIFNKWVLAAALVCSCLTCLSAQPTREQLAQIRVDKEGNFKYWNNDATSLAQLKSFVTAVTTEGGGHAYTLSGTPAVEQTRGIVISHHQKTVRK